MEKYDVHRGAGDGHSLSSKVFHRIREDILEGKYPAGAAIREAKISSDLGVSRTPVREAIRQLELEGLVAVMPHRGAVVTGISAQDIEDIYAIRTLVEGLAARWAAAHITEEQLAEMEEIMVLTEFHAERNDMRHLQELDGRFHELLYEASHSRPLQHLLSSFHHFVQKARVASFSTPGRMQHALREHRQILEGLKLRDADKAEEATTEHVRQAAANVLKQKQSVPQS